jgi:hypothetical protein
VTEYEQFKAMLSRAGVPFTEDTGTVHIEAPGWDDPNNPALHGYMYFYCDWDFNEAGELVSIGIYE